MSFKGNLNVLEEQRKTQQKEFIKLNVEITIVFLNVKVLRII